MSRQTVAARNAMDRLYEFIMQFNGGIDPTKIHNIDPQYAQQIEDKTMQGNEFLESITTLGVRDIAGQIIAFDVPRTITKRTNTKQDDGSLRRPTDPTSMVDRHYFCREMEQDVLIAWSYIDAWAHLPDFYTRIRKLIKFAKQRDLLMMMWNGQFAAANSDPETYGKLQDMMRGFLQYLIEVAPEKVHGITVDASAPGGYTIDPIRIGPGAGDNGFESMDEAAFYMKDIMIDRLFRNRKTIRIMAGDELVVTDKGQLMGIGNSKPTEAVAAKILLRTKQIGEFERKEADEFPMRGLMAVDPVNMQHLWQLDSVRAKYDEDSHEKKGVLSYYYKNCDNVIANPEACAAFHPDAIELPTGYDANGKATGWARSTELWNVHEAADTAGE